MYYLWSCITRDFSVLVCFPDRFCCLPKAIGGIYHKVVFFMQLIRTWTFKCPDAAAFVRLSIKIAYWWLRLRMRKRNAATKFLFKYLRYELMFILMWTEDPVGAFGLVRSILSVTFNIQTIWDVWYWGSLLLFHELAAWWRWWVLERYDVAVNVIHEYY